MNESLFVDIFFAVIHAQSPHVLSVIRFINIYTTGTAALCWNEHTVSKKSITLWLFINVRRRIATRFDEYKTFLKLYCSSCAYLSLCWLHLNIFICKYNGVFYSFIIIILIFLGLQNGFVLANSWERTFSIYLYEMVLILDCSEFITSNNSITSSTYNAITIVFVENWWRAKEIYQ